MGSSWELERERGKEIKKEKEKFVAEVIDKRRTDIEGFSSFLTSGEFSDWVIRLPELQKSFPVHRIFLARESLFFQTQFRSNFQENVNNTTVLHLPEDLLPHFETLLLYFYEKNVFVNQNNLFPLLSLSDRFLLEKLKKTLQTFIEEKVSIDNVVFFIQGAVQIRQEEELFPSLLRFCAKNLRNVQQDELVILPPRVFISILENEENNLSEFQEAEIICRYLLNNNSAQETEAFLLLSNMLTLIPDQHASRLLCLADFHKNSSLVEKCIPQVSVSFQGQDPEDLLKLSPQTLFHLLSREDLQVRSENSVFDFVCKYVDVHGHKENQEVKEELEEKENSPRKLITHNLSKSDLALVWGSVRFSQMDSEEMERAMLRLDLPRDLLMDALLAKVKLMEKRVLDPTIRNHFPRSGTAYQFDPNSAGPEIHLSNQNRTATRQPCSAFRDFSTVIAQTPLSPGSFCEVRIDQLEKVLQNPYNLRIGVATNEVLRQKGLGEDCHGWGLAEDGDRRVNQVWMGVETEAKFGEGDRIGMELSGHEVILYKNGKKLSRGFNLKNTVGEQLPIYPSVSIFYRGNTKVSLFYRDKIPTSVSTISKKSLSLSLSSIPVRC